MSDWTISNEEVSVGQFRYRAVSQAGTIEGEGTKAAAGAFLYKVHLAGMESGATSSVAAYDLARGLLPKSEAVYLEGSFGSWRVGEIGQSPVIHYDGRDDLLIVELQAGKYAWQGSIDELESSGCHFYQRSAVAGRLGFSTGPHKTRGPSRPCEYCGKQGEERVDTSDPSNRIIFICKACEADLPEHFTLPIGNIFLALIALLGLGLWLWLR